MLNVRVTEFAFGTYIFVAFLVDNFFVLQQYLHGLNELSVYGMQEGVPGLNAHHYQQLNHLQVLVGDRHVERSSAERVHTVLVHVVRVTVRLLQHPGGSRKEG